ncbi:hypothetical protein DWW78_10975 [Alistipes indistinctus]|jgi:hypothetical protein|uniref:hypothetical protein n=1 Tax=Alistipes indistinctus TaxID=626932 RepID=UPI000E47647F|nr:hypothetical protein [Alistipes indistinctus]RGU35535.1 hypothetical protein DWW78_10975 [Alistipes indistinctus]DAM75291.1 MAG TPA: hypothetical protein [Caudoviricetes sp.]
MKIEDLKNVRLSEMTAGYLAIYLKLSDTYGDVASITELDYSGENVDNINNDFYEAISKAMDEVMKLATLSIINNLGDLSSHTEI